MGTVILPYSSQITIDKSVDQTLVKAGAEVTLYTYLRGELRGPQSAECECS